MGGGFGGCTINIIREDCIDDVKAIVNSSYRKKFDISPEYYICDAADGAERI